MKNGDDEEENGDVSEFLIVFLQMCIMGSATIFFNFTNFITL
ncbi:MAG: hypothetical protein DDT19_01786 [Syntrophomonadaceae bacterium]|nr:hypothetical protein [Bacillota bacterium]